MTKKGQSQVKSSHVYLYSALYNTNEYKFIYKGTQTKAKDNFFLQKVFKVMRYVSVSFD